MSLELALDDRGCQFRRRILPITPNDEGRLEVVQKPEKVGQEFSIGGRLETLTCFEIELNDGDVHILTLKTNCHPSIAIKIKVPKVMNMMMWGMKA